ncbi:MAG: aspartate aminotransferase family protein [Dehalococcoidia bacterium]
MKFDKSRELFQRSKNSLAGGVSSQHRAGEKPVPLFFDRGKGSRLYDVDGNEFIDYFMGNGATIFGHAPGFLLEAVSRELHRGQVFAGQHRLEFRVSELLQRAIPCAELVRCSSSGSEVVLSALRIARAYTGRDKFIKFEGHYHGWADSVMYSVHPPVDDMGPYDSPSPVPDSAGLSIGSREEVIVLPWNDLDVLTKAVDKYGSGVAAIIMEPIACNTNGALPKPGYLEGVRQLCDQTGIVLIFDEVITGFRVALGGAQEYLGVTPDVATFAKGVAGGFPLSVLAGKREIMRAFADGTALHSGTASGNTTSLAAAEAALLKLMEDGGAVLKRVHEIGNKLIDGLRMLAQRHEEDVLIQGLGPVFDMAFTQEKELPDYRSSVKYVDQDRYALFTQGMLQRGVRLPGRGTWLLSTAHTEEDVEQTLSAADETLASM